MPNLISNIIERQPLDMWKEVPRFVHGIYCLLAKNGDVVYVGMSRGKTSGVRGRLRMHARSKSKAGRWTHFSVFQFHRSRTRDEIVELEGLLRQIYRFDQRKTLLGVQKKYKPFKKFTRNKFKEWVTETELEKSSSRRS